MVGRDRTILILCLTVFLSYLPEAGEYSSLFVYLRLVSGILTMVIYLQFSINNILCIPTLRNHSDYKCHNHFKEVHGI